MADILIVDDHHTVCFGIGMLVEEVVAKTNLFFANTFQQAVDQHHAQSMDLIILDLGIPGSLGVEMIRRFRAIQPGVKILIFSARHELFNAPIYIKAGANGFLHKRSDDAVTKTAINAILAGKEYMSEQVKENIFTDSTNQKLLPVDPIQTLSPREKQVLDLIMEGKWLKEIAGELHVKIPTIGTQKNRIFRKFGVKNMIELVRKLDSYSECGSTDMR